MPLQNELRNDDNAALRANASGLEATFKAWQEDSAKLAAQFPDVDWSHVSDFVPHINALRQDNAALRAALEDLCDENTLERVARARVLLSKIKRLSSQKASQARAALAGKEGAT